MDKPETQLKGCLAILFVKAPREGTVKTRLAVNVGPAKACAIYQSLVEIACRALAPFDHVEIRFTPDEYGDEIQHWLRKNWQAKPQGEGNLGEKLQRAFTEGFDNGSNKVVVIGSDCPAITTQDISDAFTALDETHIVFGPATDGGYWLIGLNQDYPALFDNVRWSTEHTLSDTISNVKKLDLKTSKLRLHSDIDTIEDWENWNQTHQ